MTGPARLWVWYAIAIIVGWAGTAPADSVSTAVLAGGGASMSGSGFIMVGTIGQTAISSSSGSSGSVSQGWWISTPLSPVGVDPGVIIRGGNVEFSHAYPSPASAFVRFSLRLPEQAQVSLRVYRLTGALAREVLSGTLNPGDHDVRWDTRDRNGTPCASGIYFARLLVNGTEFARRRIALVR